MRSGISVRQERKEKKEIVLKDTVYGSMQTRPVFKSLSKTVQKISQ